MKLAADKGKRALAYKIRKYEEQDLLSVVELISKCGRAVTKEEFDRGLDEPGERIRENTFVVEIDSSIAAYISLCFVEQESSAFHVFSYAAVDPEWRRRGIGGQLTRYVLEHLQSVSKEEGLALTYNQMADTRVRGQQELATAQGFKILTDLQVMCLELDKNADLMNSLGTEPIFPPGYKLRAPTLEDALSWAEVYNDAFSWSKERLPLSEESVRYEFVGPEFSPALYLLCEDEDGKAAGTLTCVLSEGGQARLQTVAVRQKEQGRGLGKALVNQCIRVLLSKGCQQVSLSVDRNNPTSALLLYENLGFRPSYQIIRYVYKIKPRS